MTVPSFSTPSGYLAFVQAAYAIPESVGKPDPDLLRLLQERHSAVGLPFPNPSSNSYAMAIESLSVDISAACRNRHGVELFESCAFGPLESQEVNARCFRSDEGYYAIVLHHGLMNMLHKRSKLLTAAANPGSVVYCNRADPSQLNSNILASWADELGEIYRSTGETKGTIVMLDREFTSAAAAMLNMSESFILGHEAGHVIAGHLEDQSRLASDKATPSLWFLPETQAHEDEFEADRYGFELMTESLGSMPKGLLLGAMVATFSSLSLIGAGEPSDSHPGVTERIHRLVETHFTKETADLVHRWIDRGDHGAAARALREAA